MAQLDSISFLVADDPTGNDQATKEVIYTVDGVTVHSGHYFSIHGAGPLGIRHLRGNCPDGTGSVFELETVGENQRVASVEL